MSRRDIIHSVLVGNPLITTRKAIQIIKNKYKIDVSTKSIQRVRRRVLMEGKNMINADENNDVFDTANTDQNEKEVNDDKVIINLNQLNDDDIIILNLANEGGYSIEQIANETVFSPDKVRRTLTRLKSLVHGEVLDEDNPDVYLSTEKGISNGVHDILEGYDALPAVGYVGSRFGAGRVTPVVNRQENFWEVEQDCVKSCSKVDNISIDVFMNYESRRRSMKYMKWAKAREWLAYLVGEFKDGAYYITDLYLPDQRTSSALVDNIKNDEFNKLSIVGVIHSHHEMGAGDANNPSFSGHDDNFINSNHDLSLLAGRDRVNGGFKIVGIARTKTPCGAFIRVKANIKSTIEDPEGDKALKDDFLSKTQTQTTTYNYNNWAGGYGYGYNPYNKVNTTQVVKPVSAVGSGGVLKPDESGIVRTRGNGFHFSGSNQV